MIWQNHWENDDIYIYTGWWCNFTTLKNDGVRQWGWDDIPYIENKIHV
jgi:hypothetical protein